MPAGEPLSATETITLLQALRTVPDPRTARGRRYSLQSIVVLALSAMLAGARSYAAIGDWATVPGHAEVALCGRPPSTSTIGRLLNRLDPVKLEAALTTWILARLVAATAGAAAGGPVRPLRQVLAADGKTVRGARPKTGTAPALVAVYDHTHQLVLTQTQVADGDEITALLTALDLLPDLDGVLLTADALHTQRATAEYVCGRGGHYLLVVKRNQPTVHTELKDLPWGQVPGGRRRRQRGHGRRECRSIKVISLDTPELRNLFPHAAQAAKIVRTRHHRGTGKTSTEVVYALTSLPHHQADPELIATWLQGHGGIENCVHHVRDVTQGENASRIRTGNGPHVMAAFRNTVLNIFRLRGEISIARAQRMAGWQAGAAHAMVSAA